MEKRKETISVDQEQDFGIDWIWKSRKESIRLTQVSSQESEKVVLAFSEMGNIGEKDLEGSI